MLSYVEIMNAPNVIKQKYAYLSLIWLNAIMF